MTGPAELARRLARNAEAVCRYYLPNGRREGRYWLVGDVDNNSGRSLFVRLTGPDCGKGAAGKWTDAATGEHGDLLDLLAATCRLSTMREALDEARHFLSLPRAEPERTPSESASRGSTEAARRLWAISRPIAGTLAEAYLARRGILDVRGCGSLRFHPRCWYRGDADDPADRVRDSWPAMIAAVRDDGGSLAGVHRTWLALDGSAKAPVSTPRRAMGHLLGHGVRFGAVGWAPGETSVLAAGEGIETMLSLKQALPKMPVIACLSANHLAALALPTPRRRLYLARDDDPAGRWAVEALAVRARAAGIEALILEPERGDFNDDLCSLGITALRDALTDQLAPEDIAPFVDGS